MTPHWSASFRTVTSLLTDRRLRSWLSGAVLTTWSLTRSKQWRWSWTSGETPCSPPTHHHEQHCDCSGVIQIPGHHNFSGPEVGQYIESMMKKAQHRLYFLRQLRKFNLPQLIQFYSAIIESVLCTSITAWFSLATKSDLRRLRRVFGRWANHWYNPPHSPRTVVSKRVGKITLDPTHPAHFLFELLLSGRRYRALSTRTTTHILHTIFFPQAIHLMNTWH